MWKEEPNSDVLQARRASNQLAKDDWKEEMWKIDGASRLLSDFFGACCCRSDPNLSQSSASPQRNHVAACPLKGW